MIAMLEKPKSNYLYCKIKDNYIEKDIIKDVIGNDPEIPQTVYNRIQENLNKGKIASAVLKLKTDDGCAYWTINKFKPSSFNYPGSKLAVSTMLTNQKCIENTQKLYHILNKIENMVDLDSANKYLDGFLEEKNLDFNDLSDYHS